MLEVARETKNVYGAGNLIKKQNTKIRNRCGQSRIKALPTASLMLIAKFRHRYYHQPHNHIISNMALMITKMMMAPVVATKDTNKIITIL